MTPPEAMDVLITAAAKWRGELLDSIIPSRHPGIERTMLEEEADDIEHAIELLTPTCRVCASPEDPEGLSSP